MDSQGFVPIVVISRFNRVRALSQDLSIIKVSLADSTFLEISEEKIRRKNGWEPWVPPTGGTKYTCTWHKLCNLDNSLVDWAIPLLFCAHLL